MKKVVRTLLYSLEWFFVGIPNVTDGNPGIAVIPFFILLFVCALITLPIWGPIWLLVKWSGYKSQM